MWWRIAVVALGLTLIGIYVPDSTDDWIDEPHERPVRIATMPCSPSLQSTSSGFVIDDGLIVTVAHGIYDSREFAVQDWTGEWHNATVRYMDLERDLALLSVRHLRARPLETTSAQEGDMVRMLEGASSGGVDGDVMRRVRISTEVIGDLNQTSKRSGYELSVEILGGDSGAAVLDAENRLVGVVFARSTRRDAAWATSASEVETIRNRRGVPHWECENDSDAELVLEPLEPRLP